MTSVGTVLSPPIPAYQNLPIEAQFFQPSQFFISAITLGNTTIVTATANMNYVVGQLARLLIPAASGCRQLNNVTGYVLSLPAANQVELNINSTGGDAFITSTTPTQPQIIAVGDLNFGVLSSTGRNIPTTAVPGAFINIS